MAYCRAEKIQGLLWKRRLQIPCVFALQVLQMLAVERCKPAALKCSWRTLDIQTSLQAWIKVIYMNMGIGIEKIKEL